MGGDATLCFFYRPTRSIRHFEPLQRQGSKQHAKAMKNRTGAVGLDSPYFSPVERNIQQLRHGANQISDNILDKNNGSDAVFDGIVAVITGEKRIYPFIDIKIAEQSGSLTKLKALSTICELVNVFRNAGFEAQTGYNTSTSEVSLTVSVKVMILSNEILCLVFFNIDNDF